MDEPWRELLKYPNPEGLHPVEAAWRDHARELVEENARLKDEAMNERVKAALFRRERDEAEAKFKYWSGTDVPALNIALTEARAEVTRLEGLILDWDEYSSGSAAHSNLLEEARRIRDRARIRAQREEQEDSADAARTRALWESRTDSTGSDKGFVRITDVRLRAQREEGK